MSEISFGVALIPDLVEQVGVVLDVLRPRRALLAPDGDRLPRRAGLLHELLRLGDVAVAVRGPVRAGAVRVPDDALREEEALRLQEPARQSLRAPARSIATLTACRASSLLNGGIWTFMKK